MSNRTGRHYTLALEHARKAGFKDPEIVEREDLLSGSKNTGSSVEKTSTEPTFDRSDVLAGMVRASTQKQVDFVFNPGVEEETWTLQWSHESGVLFEGTRRDAMRWLSQENLALEWPEWGWVHVAMNVSIGEQIATSQLRRNGVLVVSIHRQQAPLNAGLECEGWVVERSAEHRERAAVEERSRHPKFRKRSDAMEYAKSLFASDVGAKVETPTTKTVSVEVRVADR